MPAKCIIAELAAIRVQTTDPGNHDYHGPIADGRAIPDEAHERFHRSVGDVLSGKIMPNAREQMREALGKAPPHGPTTASTAKPMPSGAVGPGQQEIGIKLPR